MPLTNQLKETKKTVKRLQSEQSILLAAQHLFAAKGFVATTSKEIAQSSGLAEGLIFKYFKDKKGLLRQIMLNWFEKNLTELTALPQDCSNVKNELIILTTWILNSYSNNLDLHKIALATKLNNNLYTEFETECNNYIDNRRTIIYERLLIHQQSLQIRQDLDVQCLYEIIQSYAMTSALFLNVKPEQQVNSIKEFVSILIKGIK